LAFPDTVGVVAIFIHLIATVIDGGGKRQLNAVAMMTFESSTKRRPHSQGRDIARRFGPSESIEEKSP